MRAVSDLVTALVSLRAKPRATDLSATSAAQELTFFSPPPTPPSARRAQ